MIDDGKKTALDENAAIYQKRTKKTEKEKWSEMDSAQRKQYFVDYYLFKTVAGILAIGIAIFLICLQRHLDAVDSSITRCYRIRSKNIRRPGRC